MIYWKDGDESVAYVFDLEENLVGGPGQFTELRDTYASKGHVVEECLPEEKWDGETGFIHLSVDKCLEPNMPRQAFLCGPPLMIEAVTRVLEDKGLLPEEIFYDEF